MRRYLPLLLVAFFVLVTAFATSTYLAGYAGKQDPEQWKTLQVYTTLPLEQVSVLAQEFEKEQHIRVTIIPLSEKELLTRLQLEAVAPKADIIIANQDFLEQLKKREMLQAHISEQTDIVPDRFKDADNAWTGIWYDPMIIAANQDFLKTVTKPIVKWQDIAQEPRYRLCMTDFLAADASANLLYTWLQHFGEIPTFQLLKKMHPSIIQYAKFLATPVRMTGMGEADIAIAPYSEAYRYVQDKFPIALIYPEEGTSFLVTGVAIPVGVPHEAEAKQWIDWLLQDTTYTLLQTNRLYVIPTNPESTVYKQSGAKSIRLLELTEKYTVDQKHQLLDKWVQTIRLSSKESL